MKVSKTIGAVELYYEPLDIGGVIGLDESNGQTIRLSFDNPQQIDYLINGLNKLNELIEQTNKE